MKGKLITSWINTIKDPKIKSMLQERCNLKLKRKFSSMHKVIDSFHWTYKEEKFWQAIYDHFKHGHGLKTYHNFKHHLQVKDDGKFNIWMAMDNGAPHFTTQAFIDYFNRTHRE